MTKNTKKPKVDPVIQSARRRQRQSIARERAAADKHAGEIARRAIYDLTNNQGSNRMSKDEAIVFATSKLAKAVADSMNVSVPIAVSMGTNTFAVTDFTSISITVQKFMYDLDDPETIKRLIHFIKGLVYHEVGHIKFTVPYINLWDALNEVNKHIYSENWTGNELLNRQIHSEDFKRAWNWLEDQRMECAMVRYSPILRNYFTTIVLDFVATVPEFGWPLVAGRTYMSKDILDMFKASGAMLTRDVDPTLIGDTSKVVARYKRATNVVDMFEAICEYVHIIDRWMSQATGSGRGGSPVPTPGRHSDSRVKNKEDYEDIVNKSASEDDDNSANENTDNSSGKSEKPSVNKDSDGDDSSQNGEGGNSGSESDATPNVRSNEDQGAVPYAERDPNDKSRGTSHSPDADHSKAKEPTFNDLRKSIEEAKNEVIKHTPVSDYEAKEFIASVNTELGMDIRHNVFTTPLTEDDVSKVEEVYRGIMTALEVLAVQVEPGWRFKQEDGILDPTAFVMRDPGETNYWAHLDDIGNQGFDLAVSVMLDTSYSMHDVWCRDNGISTLAIRKACDELEIPCTVSTFSDYAEMLWTVDDEPAAVFAYPTGGTNIYQNLQALCNQRYGKTRHLVVILTDGQWSDTKHLGTYHEPGRFFMLVGLGHHLRAYLSNLGADSVITINNPTELPEHVTRALAGFLA